MIFKKPEPAPNGDNGKPPEKKSRWQGVIDHLNAAAYHTAEAQNLLSILNFDLQKPVDYLIHMRDSLVKTIEAAGGTVEGGSVEEQIRDYLPKAMQRERADEAN